MRTNPEKKALRSFGFIVGGVFAVIGLWPRLLEGQGVRTWALALAALLALPAAASPALLTYPYKAWMMVGHALGWINTRVILSLFYYVILTPVGIVFRLAGRDSMRRRYDQEAPSYRQPRESRPGSHMRQQF
jgi:hypothetical protein